MLFEQYRQFSLASMQFKSQQPIFCLFQIQLEINIIDRFNSKFIKKYIQYKLYNLYRDVVLRLIINLIAKLNKKASFFNWN